MQLLWNCQWEYPNPMTYPILTCISLQYKPCVFQYNCFEKVSCYSGEVTSKKKWHSDVFGCFGCFFLLPFRNCYYGVCEVLLPVGFFFFWSWVFVKAETYQFWNNIYWESKMLKEKLLLLKIVWEFHVRLLVEASLLTNSWQQ